MNTIDRKIIYGIGGFLLGIAITLFGMLTFASRLDTVFPSKYDKDRGHSNMMESSIDAHFFEQMVPHHEGAIQMAFLAFERSKKPEVLSFARSIVEAQEREIIQMRNWYEEWYGVTLATTSNATVGMPVGHMNMTGDDLEKLASASNFNLEFIDQMIPHHEMAVMMATMISKTTQRADLRAFAEQMIALQTREIQQMNEWKQKWSQGE